MLGATCHKSRFLNIVLGAAAGVVCVLTLSACSSQQIKNIGKTDVDMVIDAHIEMLNQYLADLTILLYKNNPDALAKTPGMTVELRLTQILQHPTDVRYTELNNARQVDAIELAMSPNFRGDRVFALMLGISSMLRLSYDDKDETFIFDKLDAQKIYLSARNLEVTLRMLRKPPQGVVIRTGENREAADYELSNTMNRMIGLQDMVSNLSESTSKRMVKKLVQNAILIPIGL